ncbi:MAG: hypothetical protein VKK42_13575, partial [Lyngbya sp.]|nr:hypothetical protein [Lyngbya sp.]
SIDQGDQFTLNANGERAQFDRINLGPFTLDVNDSEEFSVNGGGGDDSFEVNDLTGTDVQSVRFNGGDGNDTLNASNTFTPIFAEGDAGDDELLGGSGNDTLIGGEGDDILIGGAGDDILIGDLPSSPAIGVVNTLSGGDGSDDFILGNAETAYYNDGDDATAGFNDFALIADFNTEFDRIQLNGDGSRYVLNETSVEGGTGTGIYLDTNADGIYGETDELIGVVADVAITTTSADYFQYV